MAQTWVLNETLTITLTEAISTDINFTSAGISYTNFSIGYVDEQYQYVSYKLSSGSGTTVYATLYLSKVGWQNEAYRTVTFQTDPTGRFLTWLQANATQKLLCDANDMYAVADAIRTKAGSTAALAFPDGFISAVNGIQTGGSGGQETTSLNVRIATGTDSAIFGICWQASNDWMFSIQFDTSTSFILPNVLIGGYVIFFIDPSRSASFILGDPVGAEIFEPVGFDSAIDTSRVCVVFKITSANPTVVVGVYNN